MSSADPIYPMARTCPFDPPAELAQLRAENPVTRIRLWDGSSPWLVTRYEDVRRVLSDPRVSADTDRPNYPFQSEGVRTRARAGIAAASSAWTTRSTPGTAR